MWKHLYCTRRCYNKSNMNSMVYVEFPIASNYNIEVYTMVTGVQRICYICSNNLSHTYRFFVLLKYLEYYGDGYLQVRKKNMYVRINLARSTWPKFANTGIFMYSGNQFFWNIMQYNMCKGPQFASSKKMEGSILFHGGFSSLRILWSPLCLNVDTKGYIWENIWCLDFFCKCCTNSCYLVNVGQLCSLTH